MTPTSKQRRPDTLAYIDSYCIQCINICLTFAEALVSWYFLVSSSRSHQNDYRTTDTFAKILLIIDADLYNSTAGSTGENTDTSPLTTPHAPHGWLRNQRGSVTITLNWRKQLWVRYYRRLFKRQTTLLSGMWATAPGRDTTNSQLEMIIGAMLFSIQCS